VELQIINVKNRVRIKGLNEAMLEKQATNFSLADMAGVAVKSVNNARLGRIITKASADVIIETITTKDFSYLKKGPKGPRK